MIRAKRLSIALAAALVLRASSARADEPTVAQGLFEDAMTLMKEGRFAEACPKLKESHRIDPGGGTILNLAICLEKEGKTASAYVAYDEALAQAVKDGNHEREASARERLAYLKPLLAHVVIAVDPKTAAIQGLDVRLDGVRTLAPAWGIRVPIDPGKHTVSASAPSYVNFEQDVSIDESGKLYTVTVPELARGAVVESTSPPPEKSNAPEPTSRRSTVGWVLLVTGGVFIVGGATSGVLAFTNHAESNDECPAGPASCSSAGVRAEDAAARFAWGANIGLGLGLISAGIGTYLLLTTPPAAKTATRR